MIYLMISLHPFINDWRAKEPFPQDASCIEAYLYAFEWFICSHRSSRSSQTRVWTMSYSNYWLGWFRVLYFTCTETFDREQTIEYFRLSFLNNSNDMRRLINLLTLNHASRQVFDRLMSNAVLEAFFSQEQLVFILLNKKEEKWLTVYPKKINQLDKNGNNLLLCVTLHGLGRCDQSVEMLIRKGCDPKRQNTHGQTFRDVLHRPSNRELLKALTVKRMID